MRRTDLAEATLEGWARLDAAQRQRFFEAFVAAAVRLDMLELRAWLWRRLREPPLVAIDPARFTISDADIAHLLRTAGNAPGGEAAAGPGTGPMAARTRRQSLPPLFSSLRPRMPGCETELRQGTIQTTVPMIAIEKPMITRSTVSHSGMLDIASSSSVTLCRMRVGQCEPVHTPGTKI